MWCSHYNKNDKNEQKKYANGYIRKISNIIFHKQNRLINSDNCCERSQKSE